MNRTVGIGLTLLAFALFCIFCLRSHAPMIEHDVMSRTTVALVAGGIPPGGLSVDGRDVLLSGPTGSPIVSDAARKLTESIPGVRVVNVSLESDSATVAPPIPQPDAKTVTAHNVPPSAASQPQQAINTVLQTKTVEFATSSAALTKAGRETLDQIVPIVKASPGLLCQISGYTDSAGDQSFNLALSKRRAMATRDYLVSKGVELQRLSADGFGDAKPIASNETQEGRRQNRRIEFLLKEKN